MLEIDMFRPIDAPANEDATLAIEQCHADAGAIGKIFKAHLRKTLAAANKDEQ
jgi:hypothetical protein